jgi:hypothetical protein
MAYQTGKTIEQVVGEIEQKNIYYHQFKENMYGIWIKSKLCSIVL